MLFVVCIVIFPLHLQLHYINCDWFTNFYIKFYQLNLHNDTNQQIKLSAFLANIAQETSGGWVDAPGGYFKWRLYFLEETNAGIKNIYNDTSKKNYPGAE